MFRDNEKPTTISTSELCARWHVTAVTLRRWERTRGLPVQFKTGKEKVRGYDACMTWERTNMPELHRPPPSEHDDTIDLMRAGAKLGSDFVIRVEKVRRPKARTRKKK
jgi:hypothetical protein